MRINFFLIGCTLIFSKKNSQFIINVAILDFFHNPLSLYVLLKNALENFPELTVVTRDSKTKCGGTSVSKIKMNGKAYNKKTLRASKSTTKSAQVSECSQGLLLPPSDLCCDNHVYI